MALLVLFALVGIPILEIAVFIRVGGEIGLGLTLILTILTAVAGTVLLRTQGLSTLSQLQQTLDQGKMPVRALFDGACQLFAGFLLLTPGFFTDFIGLLLFVPPLRTVLLGYLVSRAHISVVTTPGSTPGETPRQRFDVEGEYKDVTPNPAPQISDQKNSD